MQQPEVQRFPVELIRPLRAELSGTIVFNPHIGLAPALWYSLEVQLAPIDLGHGAYEPDEYGTHLDTIIELGGFELPFRRWRDIAGEFGPFEDRGESSVYVSQVHCHIDIRRLDLRARQGAMFDVRADLSVDFEHAGAGYRNEAFHLAFDAEFRGIHFRAPAWNAPTTQSRLAEWDLPDTFDRASVRELCSRFVDVEQYSQEEEGPSFRFVPLRDD
jgi:hypothetical protein